MATKSRRVIDPGTRFEMVHHGEGGLTGSGRCDIVGYRCAECGETAALGSDVAHSDGCEQSDVRLHTAGDA